MLAWLEDHQGVLWAAGAASVAVFLASLLVIPALVVRIPADYFTHDERPPRPWAGRRRPLRAVLLVGKNALGGVLMAAGAAMLVLPGQGLLTLVIGFLLVDFPGKYRLEKWLVGRDAVRRPINWLRARRGREPLRAG